jgi:hypothetical protein
LPALRRNNVDKKKKTTMSGHEVQRYLTTAGGAYFASRPITEGVQADEQRQQALGWIQDVRDLLVDVENYVMDHEAVRPSAAGRSLLKEIKRLG